MLNISTSILGLTVIAVGNSMGDFVANYAVAKKSPKMAVAACFGSPLIMNIVGVGFGTLWYLATNTNSQVATPINAQVGGCHIVVFIEAPR
jgi:sodium/potassium/calcium exchanger 6